MLQPIARERAENYGSLQRRAGVGVGMQTVFTRARLVLVTLVIALCGLPSAAPAATVTLPSIRIDGAAAGDMAGTAIADAGDVNGDGHRDLAIGAPGALPAPSGGAGGAAYVVFGPFAAGTSIDLANLGTRGFAVRGSAAGLGQAAGTSVAAAGDVNRDGLADVLVGAPAASPHQEGAMTQPGRAYIVFGSRKPKDRALADLGSAGITLTGESHRFPDAFGWQVAGAGDVNHDGLADVVIAAPGNPGFEDLATTGRAYVVYGRRSGGAVAMRSLGRHGLQITGGSTGDMTSVAAAGDWNRDGRADVAVADGARRAVWVIRGRAGGGRIDLARLGRSGLVIRANPARRFSFDGATVAAGADVNGDGRPDLVIGEPQAHYAGAGPANGGAWVVRGTPSRTPITLGLSAGAAWENAIGTRGWLAGSTVALGRVNADARADTVLLAHGTPAVVYGRRAPATVRLNTMTAGHGFLIDPAAEPAGGGWTSPGAAGFTTVGTARLTGASRSDVLAGARFASHNGRERSGAAYVFIPPA